MQIKKRVKICDLWWFSAIYCMSSLFWDCIGIDIKCHLRDINIDISISFPIIDLSKYCDRGGGAENGGGGGGTGVPWYLIFDFVQGVWYLISNFLSQISDFFAKNAWYLIFDFLGGLISDIWFLGGLISDIWSRSTTLPPPPPPLVIIQEQDHCYCSRQSIHLQNFGPTSEKVKCGDIGATVYGLNLVSGCIRVNKK